MAAFVRSGRRGGLEVKLEIIQDYLCQKGMAGWLLYDFRGRNPIAAFVAGLENVGTRRWFLWIPAHGEPQWLVHAIEQATFRSVHPQRVGPLHLYIGWQDMEEKLRALLQLDGSGIVAMEYSPHGAIPYVSNVDAGTLEMVVEVTGATVVSSADLVQLVQAVLSQGQMASHRRAAAHVLAAKDAAFAFVAASLRTGQEITEYDVQQLIVERFCAENLEWDHDPIVAVNGNAAVPHYAPTAQNHSPIRRGDVLLIDLWAKEKGSREDCYADVTWTAYCGAEPPAAVQQVFAAVAQARDMAIATIQQAFDAGRTIHGYEVDDVAREAIDDAGFAAGILHRTGHSLGPTVHGNGVNIDNVETQDRRTLIPGVLFTIEPGIYLPDMNFDGSVQAKGLGIRSEVNCIVHDGRLEVTTLPFQTEIIRVG